MTAVRHREAATFSRVAAFEDVLALTVAGIVGGGFQVSLSAQIIRRSGAHADAAPSRPPAWPRWAHAVDAAVFAAWAVAILVLLHVDLPGPILRTAGLAASGTVIVQSSLFPFAVMMACRTRVPAPGERGGATDRS